VAVAAAFGSLRGETARAVTHLWLPLITREVTRVFGNWVRLLNIRFIFLPIKFECLKKYTFSKECIFFLYIGD